MSGTLNIAVELVIFFSLSRQIPEYYLRLGHNHFLPYPFQFINHPTIWHYIVWATDRTVK
jgi:hypothetical protein